LRPANTEYILCSNDRPDIHIVVRPLVYPANSFKDLAFLIPETCKSGDISNPPPKFIVFFDDMKETQEACKYLRSRLSESLRDKVKYFHATMTQSYREEETVRFFNSDIWGMCCTDAFGMGVDLSDIEIVIQFKATCNLCTLWQRFGRAACGSGKEGTAILLVERKDTKEGRLVKEQAQKKRR
ncbi:P-loop containing nucleoside triphosphate hydrolase protein, partial [Cyathus striatus]